MTRQASFKHKIRTRMEKTGERYAAARQALLRQGSPVATTYLDANGNFTFSHVRRGSYVVRGRIDGFEEINHPVDVSDFGSAPSMIVLNRKLDVQTPDDDYIVHVDEFLERYPKKAVKLFEKAHRLEERGPRHRARELNPHDAIPTDRGLEVGL